MLDGSSGQFPVVLRKDAVVLVRHVGCCSVQLKSPEDYYYIVRLKGRSGRVTVTVSFRHSQQDSGLAEMLGIGRWKAC